MRTLPPLAAAPRGRAAQVEAAEARRRSRDIQAHIAIFWWNWEGISERNSEEVGPFWEACRSEFGNKQGSTRTLVGDIAEMGLGRAPQMMKHAGDDQISQDSAHAHTHATRSSAPGWVSAAAMTGKQGGGWCLVDAIFPIFFVQRRDRATSGSSTESVRAGG